MGKDRFIFVTLLILIACSFPASIQAQTVRGVTDTEILIGQWSPQTGPAAPWGAVARGTGLLFKGINDEGGIHGRKIKYFLRDDAYQPAKTKAIGKEFLEEIGVFAVVGGVGVAGGMTNRDALMEKKVSWIGPVTGVHNWIQPFQKYLFGVYPLFEDEAYALAGFLHDKMRFKKVAVFYQNDDYGKQGLNGVEKYFKEKNVALVAKVTGEVTDRDLSTHAMKLKNSGAEAVVIWTNPTHSVLILAESAKIGFKPQWATTNGLADGPFMLQISKGLWAGMINSQFLEPIESNLPLLVKYRAWWQKYEPKERWGLYYVAGILFGEPLVEGLKRAGKNLTPDSFVAAMETLKDWRGIGLPVTFSPTERQGGKHVYFSQVLPDGSYKKLSDWVQITK